MTDKNLNIKINVENTNPKAIDNLDKSIQNVEKSSGSLSKSLGKVGKNLAIVGGAISGAFLLAGREAEKMEKQIILGTGASGEALEELMVIADSVAKTVPNSFEEIGLAVAEINTRFDVTGEQLQEISKYALDFARITNVDIGTATTNLGRIFNATGMEVENVEDLLNKLQLASEKTGISANSLINNIIDAGPAFEELGYGVTESIALFAQFEAAGARPEEVISSLGMVMNNFAREGLTDAGDAWRYLMENIEDAEEILTATGIALDSGLGRVASKVAEDIRAGRFDIEDFTEALENSEGVFKAAALNSLLFDDKLRMLRNQITLLLKPLGSQMIDMLKNDFVPIMEKAIGVAQGLANGFGNLPDGVKKAVAVFILALPVIGSVMMLLPKIVVGVKLVVAAFGLLTGALTSPVLLIGGLVVGLGLLAKRLGVFEFIGNSFKNLMEAFKTEQVQNKLSELSNKFIELRDRVQPILDRLSQLWSAFAEKIGLEGSDIGISVETFADMIVTALDGIIWVIDKVIGYIDFWGDKWNLFFDLLEGKISIWDYFKEVIAFGSEKINEAISNAFQSIKDRLSKFFLEDIPFFLGQAYTFFEQLPAQIGSSLVKLVGVVAIKFEELKQWVIETSISAVTTAFNLFNDLPSKISTINLKDVGIAVIQGFLDGLKQKWNDVTSWIGEALERFKTNFKLGVEVRSPSRWAMRVGGFVGEGFGIGAVEGLKKSENWIEKAIGGVKGMMQQSIGGVVGALGSGGATSTSKGSTDYLQLIEKHMSLLVSHFVGDSERQARLIGQEVDKGVGTKLVAINDSINKLNEQVNAPAPTASYPQEEEGGWIRMGSYRMRFGANVSTPANPWTQAQKDQKKAQASPGVNVNVSVGTVNSNADIAGIGTMLAMATRNTLLGIN